MGLERQAAIAALLLAASAGAQERLEFKGVPLGATQAEFRAKNPLFTCRESSCYLNGVEPRISCALLGKENRAPQDCLTAVRAAGTYATIPSLILASFNDGVLATVTARFASSGYRTVIGALSTRYGAPSLPPTGQDETAMWRLADDGMVMARPRSANGEAVVIITTRQEIDRSRASNAKKAADDL